MLRCGNRGTLSGIGEVLKNQYPDITIWAVETGTRGDSFRGSIGTHLQMGIGDGLIPENLNMDIYEDICVVTDEEALEVSKRLAREEGLLCGISSGSNVAAAIKLAKKLGLVKQWSLFCRTPESGISVPYCLRRIKRFYRDDEY